MDTFVLFDGADAALPNIDRAHFQTPRAAAFDVSDVAKHPPRFLLLHGSLRARSYSRLLTFEAGRLLQAMGGEVRSFDPAGLPLPDAVGATHPKVPELRDLAPYPTATASGARARHSCRCG